MNQSKLIYQYNEENKYPFNEKLFERNDDDIIEELKKIILSCSRQNKYFGIQVTGFDVVEDYDQINSILKNYYDSTIKNKTSNRKKDNKYEYIDLKDSEIKLLIVHYYLTVEKDQSKQELKEPTEQALDVIIMVPRHVDKYYFKINGIYYLAMQQIVDASTYNNSTNKNAKNPNITMKIAFMATRIFRLTMDMATINGDHVKCSYYMARIFNKSVGAIDYILAKNGLLGSINFLGLRGIEVTETPNTREDHYCFKKAENLFISVPKMLFDADHVTQSFVYSVYQCLIEGMKYSDIFDNEFWVRILGGKFNNYNNEKMLAVLNDNNPQISDTIGKGYSIIDSFENIYDISTRESLRLPDDAKEDMYHVIRWIMREFNYLRRKDNLDLSIKKTRYAHYIAILYAMKIVKGIARVADLNKRVTISSIRRAINTNPNYLLKSIVKCKLVNYRNMVNDMDSMAALKHSFKGISGLGESSNNSIPDIFRAINPSHLGIVDLDSSSNTDPGISGTICPFADVYDGYFSDFQEPNFWEKEFEEVVNSYVSVTKLLQPLDFQEKVLGRDVSIQRDVLFEVIHLCEQLIKPMIFEEDL